MPRVAARDAANVELGMDLLRVAARDAANVELGMDLLRVATRDAANVELGMDPRAILAGDSANIELGMDLPAISSRDSAKGQVTNPAALVESFPNRLSLHAGRFAEVAGGRYVPELPCDLQPCFRARFFDFG